MDLSRQALIMPDKKYSWLILGAGGIGSNIAYNLACLGQDNITVFDFDVVEEPNIAPAFYSVDQLGQPKVEALAHNIELFTGAQIKVFNEKFTKLSWGKIPDADMIVLTVDGLDKRRKIWEEQPPVKWLYWWDLRMGGANCSVAVIPNWYAIHSLHALDVMGENQEEEALNKTQELFVLYEEESLNGEEQELPCGEKAVAFLTKGMIPGLFGDTLYRILNRKKFYRQRYVSEGGNELKTNQIYMPDWFLDDVVDPDLVLKGS